MGEEVINKRGQVAIFVILALLLIGAMILFFVVDREPTSTAREDFNAGSFIEGCVRKHVNDAVDIMLPQGGFIEPVNTRTYNDIEVIYLCENSAYYSLSETPIGCINQHPLLLREMSKEIHDYIIEGSRIPQCFSDLRFEIEKREGEVSYGPLNLNVTLAPGKVVLDLKRSTTITKLGDTQVIENFDVEVLNPIYELGKMAMEIASQEAVNCAASAEGLTIESHYYKRGLIIEKPVEFSDSTAIYTIEDKRSGKVMNIAIRSCPIPPGISP